MSRSHSIKNDNAIDRPDRLEERPPAAEHPLDLPDLAYECEGLVIRDPRLPHALVRALLDVASALRDEAQRRSGR